jgi:hypothetical protein
VKNELSAWRFSTITTQTGRSARSNLRKPSSTYFGACKENLLTVAGRQIPAGNLTLKQTEEVASGPVELI